MAEETPQSDQPKPVESAPEAPPADAQPAEELPIIVPETGGAAAPLPEAAPVAEAESAFAETQPYVAESAPAEAFAASAPVEQPSTAAPVFPADPVAPPAAPAAEPVPLVEPEAVVGSYQPPPVAAPPVEAPPAAPPADQFPAPSALPVAVPAPEAAAAAAPRVVFVEAPVPPRKQGNRGIGVLFALLGTLVFALVYGLVIMLLIALVQPTVFPLDDLGASPLGFGGVYTAFLASPYFWVPVLAFLVAYVLLVLLLNRAGWPLHILASILLALVVYFASIGVFLLFDGVGLMTPTQASEAFAGFALDPRLLIAAVAAREVAVWMGLAIAARGRKVRQRNAERLSTFEREVAETRAEHERAAAGA